jgi:hypothetical protein
MAELTFASILRKTEAGVAAFKLNDRTLPLAARSLLIMVDGTKSLQVLSRFSPHPDEVISTATYLIDKQLVEVSAALTSPEPKPRPLMSSAQSATAIDSPAAKPTPVPTGDLKTTIRKATRALEDLLGPSSEPLSLKIEKCKNMDELTATIQSIRPVVASMRSESKAVEFINKALS